MRDATSNFLKLKPTAKLVEVKNVVVRGAKPNHCYMNTLKYYLKDESRYAMQAGWLVGEDFNGSTALIPHYWIFDKTKELFFDVTPKNEGDIQTYEYVIDDSILEHATIDSYMPPPLFFVEPSFFMKNKDNKVSVDVSNMKSIYDAIRTI